MKTEMGLRVGKIGVGPASKTQILKEEKTEQWAEV